MNMMKINVLVSTVAVLLASDFVVSQENNVEIKEAKAKMKYAIAIHGGAGPNPKKFTEESLESRRASMHKALEIGVAILKQGGESIDAVEKVVRFLEDDPQFNAGVGAVFNSAGGHELDASIMDGRNLACGAVAGVRTVKNPISLARKVMTETRHVLFAGDGAEEFAKTMGVELVEPSHFDTKRTREAFNRIKAELGEHGSWQKETKLDLQEVDTGSYHGTVGCVALDSNGNLAAATSTGGMTNKQFGRVGDSPIVGAGTYADNKTCAVSCTGHGEQYIRNAVAYDVCAQVKYRGYTIGKAVDDVLKNRLEDGAGGIIVVDKDGNIAMEFTTAGMARSAADSSGRFDVLWGEGLMPDVK